MAKFYAIFGKECKMSRVGLSPVTIPSGCTVELKDNTVVVKSKNGQLDFSIPKGITVEIDNNTVFVKRENELKTTKSFHGLTRAMINNMIIGVTTGYSKVLALVWKGGTIESKNNNLKLSVNFINKEVVLPKELKLENVKKADINIAGIEKSRIAGVIKISGIDKQLVGEYAAKIRALLPPEPYHGKGIRYIDERVPIKQGKTNA